MSTKTTLKRIALVAVSALGFGLLSVNPASAAPAHTAAATLSTTSLTVVAGASGGSSEAGRFYVDLTDDEGTLSGLFSDESISVTVIADPTTATAVSDLTIRALTTTDGTSFSGVTGAPAATATTYQVPSGSAAYTVFDSGNWSYSATAALNNEANRYWFSVYGNSTAVDAGAYTIRVRVINGDAAGVAFIDKTLSISFVSTIDLAGAALTLAKSGDLYDGEPLKYETNRYVSATLTNGTAGGRVQLGVSDTASLASTAPALNATILDADGANDQIIDSVYDTGVATQDHVASTTAAEATYQTYAKAGDGVYGVYDAEITANVSSTKTLRVRVTETAVSASTAIVIRDASGAYDNLTDLTLTADGISAAAALTQSNVATTTAYTLPLTTKSAKLTINVDGATANLADQAITTKVTWSGNYASADVSPATTTSSTTFTDASGNTSITVTNSAPLAGGVATILITGFKFVSGTTSDPNGSGSRTVTLTWAKPVATTVTVLDPIDDVYAKTGSTTTFSVRVADQFGTAMAGEAVRPSLSSTSANYSATTTYTAVTTDANGTATWSLTDAAADADDTDVITFTSLTTSTATDSYTITYKASLPAVSTITGFFSDDFDATSITASIPSTGVLTDAGASLPIKYDRDLSKSLAANTEADEDDMLAIKLRAVTSAGAAARGASVTLTAGSGGHVLNTSGLPSTARTKAVDADGYVTFQIASTKPGAISFTATSGTSTYTFTVNVAVPTQTKARFVTLTGATTGTSNGEGVPMTALVTDRYGNGVSGVTITAAASGAGSFMGGATTQSFTTDSTGTYTFLATSLAEAGGSATFSVTMGNAGDSTSVAGKFGSSTIDSTVAAGKNSASATVTFAAGKSATTAAAEAATDAAAEAIDAANAATDAANLAAEAADAATVAAEEARDAADAATAAVEELATQVATLMAALKAQITTLANTVAKIAKKVKA